MNNRAALVDSWRPDHVQCQRPGIEPDGALSGDMNTVGNNPLKFRAPTGTVRAGLQFDAPFTRLLERKQLRQVADQLPGGPAPVNPVLRMPWSRICGGCAPTGAAPVNLEIQRRAVVIAIRRVDRTRDVRTSRRPPQARPAVTPLGPTAAMDLLTALNDVRSAAEQFHERVAGLRGYADAPVREWGSWSWTSGGCGSTGRWRGCADSRGRRAPAADVPDVWLEELDKSPPQSGGPKKLPPAESPPPPPQPSSPARKARCPSPLSEQDALPRQAKVGESLRDAPRICGIGPCGRRIVEEPSAPFDAERG